jgi:hypothetical protein
MISKKANDIFWNSVTVPLKQNISMKLSGGELTINKKETVELWTHGSYDRLNDIDFAISFEVPEKWLANSVRELGYCNIEDFLDTYTWDISEDLYIKAKNEGKMINLKSGMFGNKL